jgi:hypothetical protein
MSTMAEQAQAAQEAPELTVEELRRFRFVTVFASRTWGIACTGDKQLMDELFPHGEYESCCRDSVTKSWEYQKSFGPGTVENALVVMREREPAEAAEEAA